MTEPAHNDTANGEPTGSADRPPADNPVRVFEIVDRLNNKRPTEVVYLSANRALDQIAAWVVAYNKPEIEKQYRVQEVRVDG